LAGFPCQSFSVANNKRSLSDDRNFLYKEMLRFIEFSKPKVVVAENVKGILSFADGFIFQSIKKDLENLGYFVDYKLLNSADYGVPQYRQRVFIIANKTNKKFQFPKPLSFEEKTVKETIGYLKDIPISYHPIKQERSYIYNHIASTNVHDKFWSRKYSVKQEVICDYLKKYRKKSGISTKKIDDIFGYRHTAGHWFRKDNNSGSIPKPEDWKRLKKILKLCDKYDKQVMTLEQKNIIFEQSLRITNWNRPSDTITASQPEIHKNKKRRLSVRECAMLQTFPSDFVFGGSLASMYRQVGNAVPVKLSKKIAKEVSKII